MNVDIPHWHVVKTANEMVEETFRILQDPNTTYRSQSPYPIRDCVNKVMDLFGPKNETI
jgi:hypothetical protein